MTAQATFAMIKPDATKAHFEGDIVAAIHDAGFKVTDLRRLVLPREDAEWLYREHAGRAHFGDLVDFTVSGDVVLMRVESSDDPESTSVATDFRTLMGATAVADRKPGTLRHRFASGLRENAIHGSDSPEAAQVEIARFFPAVWPATPEMAECEPSAVAAIAIRQCAHDRMDEGQSEFWGKVAENAKTIASWAVSGLGISGRAR